MKRWNQFLLMGIMLLGMWFAAGVQAEASVPVDEANFPDEVVRAYAERVDQDNNGVLSDAELQTPTFFVVDINDYVSEAGAVAKPGAVVNFKGMENFPNIKKVGFYHVGTSSAAGTVNRWNYADSDFLQYFPYAESLYMDGNIGYGDGSEIALSGESACLKEVEIRSYWVQWDVKAENLKDLKLVASWALKSGKFTSEYLPSLENLYLNCAKVQNCDLSMSGMSSLKNLELTGSMTEQDLRNNGLPLSNLSALNLSRLGIFMDIQDYRFLSDLAGLKELVINQDLQDSNFSLEGLSSLEELNLSGALYRELNLSPVKKTLKTLRVGVEGTGDEYACTYYEVTNRVFKKLDISQMENLESVYASYTAIEELVTRDASGNAGAQKLKRLHMYHSGLKSIDVADLPNLEELYVGDHLSKLDVSKNKKLKHLAVKSDKIKSLNVKKNVELESLLLEGKKVKTLDLSKNTSLRGMSLKGTLKLKKVVCPMIKKTVKWGSFIGPGGNAYVSGKKCSINTLDLSRVKKFTKKSRFCQFSIIGSKNKKVIISKKLKKSDREWIKKRAKKAKAKVVVK